MKARDFMPAVKYGAKWYPEDLAGVGYMTKTNNYFFVDGDKSASGGGKSWEDAYKTIQAAVDAAAANDVIFIAGRTPGLLATDPVSYAETIIIPNSKPNLSLIGVSRGLTQGGLPQLKVGTASSAIIEIRAPGCYIANLGINGVDGTGGGIKLSDDGGTTYSSFGTTIENCHFKNCQSSGKASTGGAITNLGGAWQMRVSRCRFYKNRAGIVLGAVTSVPQDVVIEGCEFGGDAVSSTVVDADIYTADTLGLLIKGCNFLTPDVPNYASGDADRYIKIASSVGLISDCNFACLVNPAATEVTFGAAGTAGIIPATVRIANCWGETSSTTERGWVCRL